MRCVGRFEGATQCRGNVRLMEWQVQCKNCHLYLQHRTSMSALERWVTCPPMLAKRAGQWLKRQNMIQIMSAVLLFGVV